jgi:hypothetical protein
MSGQGSQDPLECLRPENLESSDDDLIKTAKAAIASASSEAVTPDTHAKHQEQLRMLLDASPNKVATANFLLKHICENGLAKTWLIIHNGCEIVRTGGRWCSKRTREMMEEDDKESRDSKGTETDSKGIKPVGRSSKFSSRVSGICQITGFRSEMLVPSHILPFASSKGGNEKMKQYLELLRALFGPDALERSVENVLNRGTDGTRNINRLDNGIAMLSSAHVCWDTMDFFIEVL